MGVPRKNDNGLPRCVQEHLLRTWPNCVIEARTRQIIVVERSSLGRQIINFSCIILLFV